MMLNSGCSAPTAWSFAKNKKTRTYSLRVLELKVHVLMLLPEAATTSHQANGVAQHFGDCIAVASLLFTAPNPLRRETIDDRKEKTEELASDCTIHVRVFEVI